MEGAQANSHIAAVGRGEPRDTARHIVVKETYELAQAYEAASNEKIIAVWLRRDDEERDRQRRVPYDE